MLVSLKRQMDPSSLQCTDRRLILISTYTDIFTSHHPVHQKLGVVRTLLNRCHTIISKDEDNKLKDDHLKKALAVYGYLAWSFKEVADKQKRKEASAIRAMKNSTKDRWLYHTSKVSQSRQSIQVASYNHSHEASLHTQKIVSTPLGKCEITEQGQLVYKITCKSCDKSYRLT